MAYSLVKDTVSRDTIEALQQLLDGAKEGNITGIAFAVTLKNRRYLTDVAGACFRDATATRGMVAALDDELAAIVQQRSENETR